MEKMLTFYLWNWNRNVSASIFSVSIFLGSIIRYLLEKKFPNWMKNYFVALASVGIVG